MLPFSSNCTLTPVTDVKLRAYDAAILPPLIQFLTTRERMVLQNSIATIRNLSSHPEVKAALMEAGAVCVSSPPPSRHAPTHPPLAGRTWFRFSTAQIMRFRSMLLPPCATSRQNKRSLPGASV